jgi:dienelactone hydrolase
VKNKTCIGLALALATATGIAQPVDIDATLNESVQVITKTSGLFPIDLETTIYKPAGDGPFSIAVINHGKAPGNPRFQNRYRPTWAVRYFLQRGYAVVVPMRQGFSRSGGSYIGGGCNVESNGRVQAEDVKAVLDHITAQPWANKDHIIVVGQSHGGWTTLAFGSQGYPGLKGLVNFAGGLRQDQCPNWKEELAEAAAGYARDTRLPSIWFYGDNDSFFDPPTWRTMFEEYNKAAGGKAQLVAFGNFGADAHALFGSRSGMSIWQPELSTFLASIEPQREPAPLVASVPHAVPASPAAIEDGGKLPHVRAKGRVAYKAYLAKKARPKAFAIARNGSWGWAGGGREPLRRAVANCNRTGKGTCRLYAVDDAIVWKPE